MRKRQVPLMKEKMIKMKRRRKRKRKRRKMIRKMNMGESMETRERPNKIMKRIIMRLKMVSTTRTSSLSSFPSCSSNGMQRYRWSQT